MNKQEWLNKLLGDELIAHLQYAIASKTVFGTDYDACASEFDQHSKEELEHFNKILDLMVQRHLEVEQDLLTLIKESKSGYEIMSETASKELVKFHIQAEKNAINTYREFLDNLTKEEQKDYALIHEIKNILSDEIEHRTDLEIISSSINNSAIEKQAEISVSTENQKSSLNY